MGTELLVSIGSWEWVANTIENEASAVNGMLMSVENFMVHPEIYDAMVNAIPDGIKQAFSGVALTLVTLFLLIGFINKSLDLKWVTWENVLMFFIKFLIAKICVENSGFIMSCIFKGFNSLTDASVSSLPSIFPYGKDAYSFFLNSNDAGKLITKPSLAWYDFTPVGLWLLVIVQSLVMKGIMAVTLIIVLARFMELTIYTIAAPLPLSTLGCEGLQDIGKSYLKSYAACCIHAAVLILIFSAYGALNTSLDSIPGYWELKNVGFIGIIKTFILGGTVMKSEQWAKRICGAL